MLDKIEAALPELNSSVAERRDELRNTRRSLVTHRTVIRDVNNRRYRSDDLKSQLINDLTQITTSLEALAASALDFSNGIQSLMSDVTSPDARKAFIARALYEERKLIEHEANEKSEAEVRQRREEAEKLHKREQALEDAIKLLVTLDTGSDAAPAVAGTKEVWLHIKQHQETEITEALQRLERAHLLSSCDSARVKELLSLPEYPDISAQPSVETKVSEPHTAASEAEFSALKQEALEKLGFPANLAAICAAEFSIDSIATLEGFVSKTPVSPALIRLLLLQDPNWSSSVERLTVGVKGLIPLAQAMHKRGISVNESDTIETLQGKVLGKSASQPSNGELKEVAIKDTLSLRAYVLDLVAAECEILKLNGAMVTDILCYGFRYRGSLHSDTKKISEQSTIENVIHYSPNADAYKTPGQQKALAATLKALSHRSIIFSKKGYGLFRNHNRIPSPAFREAVSQIMITYEELGLSVR